MSFLSAAKSGISILKEDGPRQMARDGFYFGYEQSLKTVHSITGLQTKGTHVFDDEWDVLVILDACRVDLLSEVSPDYPFLQSAEFDSIRSLGSHSEEWMNRTFTEEHADVMSETAYITGNPFSETAVSDDQFHTLEEVWKYGWDESENAMSPRPITDVAIQTWRDKNPQRMILHYMQPHCPFIGYNEQLGSRINPSEWGNVNNNNPWRQLRDGELEFETVWAAYKDTLELVLDEVELLKSNLDGTMVISADHANAVGEYGLYGHPPGVAIDELRTVPWVTFEATDEETYSAETYDKEMTGTVEERLENLGYV